MSSGADQAITVYSDYVCPFCYPGGQSLPQYQETGGEEFDIDWHPFDLRSQERRPDGSIDFSVDDGKDEDYYEQARQGVRRLQGRYDVEMTLDPGTDVDSLPAQIVSCYLKGHADYEMWLAFDGSIFEVLRQNGKNIGDKAVLVELTESVGIDGEEVTSVLDDETLRTEVRERSSEAQQHGVTGVPTFAYEGCAVRRAVPPEQLERLVEGVQTPDDRPTKPTAPEES